MRQKTLAVITKLATTSFLLALLLWVEVGAAQKIKADSLSRLLEKETTDTTKVRLLWQMADAVNIYNPDTAVRLSQQAIYLSKEIKYTEGLSKSLASMANAVVKMGNYPHALDLYFQKLQLEEKRNIPRNLASVFMNIGIVYTMQEEFEQAKDYYYRADSLIRQYHVADMLYYIKLNLGDVYNRLDQSDSAYRYFNESLAIATTMNDADLIAASRTGLGHSYRKMKLNDLSLTNYKLAISGLEAVDDDEILCEATLGLANLYRQRGKKDSAIFYAVQSETIARKDDFLSHELDAMTFLADIYNDAKNTDSAFAYLNRVHVLNNAINSKARIRESQILSTNEQLRQLELEETKKELARERHQQLQLLFIGMFIPGLFLFTLLLSRIKIHQRIIKILGILSLLVLFEYLTLLLHPYVLDFTHHTPVYEILIFVSLAAVLIPGHHRIEHWLIERLTRGKTFRKTPIRLTIKKIKYPSN